MACPDFSPRGWNGLRAAFFVSSRIPLLFELAWKSLSVARATVAVPCLA